MSSGLWNGQLQAAFLSTLFQALVQPMTYNRENHGYLRRHGGRCRGRRLDAQLRR